MNRSKPTQSRVLQREVALSASCGGCLIIVSMAFGAWSPVRNETPAASANASPSASDQTEARGQIEAAAIEIWQAVARGDSAAILADYAYDAKWPDYLEYCDRFYFGVPEEFPRDLIPEEAGLIVADSLHVPTTV